MDKKDKKLIVGFLVLFAILIVATIFSKLPRNQVQQAFSMTMTNQQLASAHLVKTIGTTTTTTTITIPTTTTTIPPSPYTSHTIV